MKSGVDVFETRIRTRDRCSNYECKSGNLFVKGVAEEGDKYYKVIACCEVCGKFYSFTRMDRRKVEWESARSVMRNL